MLVVKAAHETRKTLAEDPARARGRQRSSAALVSVRKYGRLAGTSGSSIPKVTSLIGSKLRLILAAARAVSVRTYLFNSNRRNLSGSWRLAARHDLII